MIQYVFDNANSQIGIITSKKGGAIKNGIIGAPNLTKNL
jgi:hypothetical protein